MGSPCTLLEGSSTSGLPFPNPVCHCCLLCTVCLCADLVCLQLGVQAETASREESGPVATGSSWAEAVRVGAPVSVEVQEVREYGLVLGFPGEAALSDIVGFAASHQGQCNVKARAVPVSLLRHRSRNVHLPDLRAWPLLCRLLVPRSGVNLPLRHCQKRS